MLTLASSVSDRGELTLSRRADGALELRVNGLFAMDTAETTSERLLASAAIDAATTGAAADGGGALRVLVGGLGLGFTVAALLGDARVASVVVAEIEPDLVQWHRAGVVPHPTCEDSADSLLDDRRIEVQVADVRDVVASEPPGSYDLLLLDVDNGPGFLLYEGNAEIYREPFLAACADVVRAGGVVAIWSASEAPGLGAAMGAVFASADVRAIRVTLDRGPTHYHLYLGRTLPEGDRHAR